METWTYLDYIDRASSENLVHAWMFLRSNANISRLEPFAFLELSGCNFRKIPVLVEDTRTLDLDFTLLILGIYDPFFVLVVKSHLNARQRESDMSGYTVVIVESGAEQYTAENRLASISMTNKAEQTQHTFQSCHIAQAESDHLQPLHPIAFLCSREGVHCQKLGDEVWQTRGRLLAFRLQRGNRRRITSELVQTEIRHWTSRESTNIL